MDKLTKQKSKELIVANFRNQVIDLENELLSMEHEQIVKGNSESFPLTHSFSEGVYIREMKMHKGGIVIGKIHNRSHTWFLMKGHLQVATESGTFEYKAPTYVNAKSGAKRVIKALEDSIFINVHPNPNNIKDTDKLEEILTCTGYEEYENMNNKT